MRHIKGMPVSMEVLRGVLALLCIFFAHFLGRSVARVYLGKVPQKRMYSWLLRTLITALAIPWRHGLDTLSLAAFLIAAVVLAFGVWDELRPRREEDLTQEIFRDPPR